MSEYTTTEGLLVITVDKIGGGTVGRSYDGDWEVTVSEPAMMVLDDVITTGTPKTHREVAELATEFAEYQES